MAWDESVVRGRYGAARRGLFILVYGSGRDPLGRGLEFLHSGRARVGQTIGLCRLSLSPRLTLAMVLLLSHRMMVGIAVCCWRSRGRDWA